MPVLGEAWDVLESYRGPAYGVAEPSTWAAIRRMARREGLLLDPVYTGKVMAGLVALARQGAFAPGARVLFVHTGGGPALFGYERTISKHLRDLDEGTTPYPLS